jgi:hypothetical protein
MTIPAALPIGLGMATGKSINTLIRAASQEMNRRIYNYVDPTQAYPDNLTDAFKLFAGSLLHGN